jgi:hypothetical protein
MRYDPPRESQRRLHVVVADVVSVRLKMHEEEGRIGRGNDETG